MAVNYYSDAIFLEQSIESYLSRANLYAVLNNNILAQKDFNKAKELILIESNKYENLSPNFRNSFGDDAIAGAYRTEIFNFEKRVSSGISRLNNNVTVSELKVIINELDADNESYDELEFVEIKTNLPNSNLTGYVLVFFNGSSNGANSSYNTIDLSGFKTDIIQKRQVVSDFINPSIDSDESVEETKTVD